MWRVCFLALACAILCGVLWPSERESSLTVTSSVWCREGVVTSCRFHNLCYLPESRAFAMFLSMDSTLSLPHPDLLNRIPLSSVANHTAMDVPLVTLPSHASSTMQFDYYDDPVFLMWRFKSDNILHALHDDLMPLFFAYEELGSTYTLVVADEQPPGQYFELYGHFSRSKPLFLHQVKAPVCFRHLQTGLSVRSIVYQYGFGSVHGPIEDVRIHAGDLKRFTRFVLSKLGIAPSEGGKISFVQRLHNRRILNEDQVLEVVQKAYPNHDGVIKLESEGKISELVASVAASKMMIGMHGAALALSIFLPPNATLIELFPYGIGAHVSPYKPLSLLPGREVHYKSWMTPRESDSVGYPNAAPEVGGIAHLPEETQQEILQTKVIPPVHCCHNPAYMFRMYQDTVVDLHSFREILVQKPRPSVHDPMVSWLIPSVVLNLHCQIVNYSASANWTQPVNALYLPDVTYDVVIRVGNFDVNISTKQTTVSLPSIPENSRVDVWVACVSREVKSRDSWTRCD